jgi:HD-like signal output (HDOD) protein
MAQPARFLQSVKLPVMPEVAQALIRTLNDDTADVRSVTPIIAKDPALTATLLRMSNSAIFGLSRSVKTLESAVSVVGVAHIRARALSICMASIFEFPPGLKRLDFWRYSMVCAGYAKWLAANAGLDEQQAWLTGMMLRLGEVLIAQRLPEVLDQTEALPDLPGQRWARQYELAGVNEGQIAAELAQRWDFPELVVEALQHTATPLSDSRSALASVVHLAALIADQPTPSSAAFHDLPVAVVLRLNLNIPKLLEHFPCAELFNDISMLQG